MELSFKNSAKAIALCGAVLVFLMLTGCSRGGPGLEWSHSAPVTSPPPVEESPAASPVRTTDPGAPGGALREALRALSWEDAERFVREDNGGARDLPLSSGMFELLCAAADTVRAEGLPDGFQARSGGVSLYMNGSRRFSLFAGEEPFRVLIRYAGGGVDESAAAEDPELYLYLLAVAEEGNAELHDLDGDGDLETLAWPSAERDLIIYDGIGGGIRRIDANETLHAAWSDYTGLVANIKDEYGNMVSAAGGNGEAGVYRYRSDGTFAYETPLEDALRG